MERERLRARSGREILYLVEDTALTRPQDIDAGSPLSAAHVREDGLIHVLRLYGYPFFFLVVLAESLGLPVPSFPFILISAALATELHFRLAGVVALSVLAAHAGDAFWYFLGRRRGRSVLQKLCSLSLNADSCVGRTEDFFARNGLKTLLVAKFIPGLNAVASPLAGMLKTSYARFVLFDLGGIGLWVMSAVLLGLVSCNTLLLT